MYSAGASTTTSTKPSSKPSTTAQQRLSLHDVVYGNLSTTLAAEEVVWAATAKSSDVYLKSLSLQIGFLASEYSFL